MNKPGTAQTPEEEIKERSTTKLIKPEMRRGILKFCESFCDRFSEMLTVRRIQVHVTLEAAALPLAL